MTQQSEALQLAKDMRAFGYKGIRPEGVRILCEALLATPPAAPQPEQELVGTVKELFNSVAWEKLNVRGSVKVYLDKDALRDAMEPLQNTTPPAAQPAQRKPLTDEQQRNGFRDQDSQWTFKGMAAWQVWQKACAWNEAAHGIGENNG